MPEVIGIDHIYVSVSNIERSQVFYDKLFVGALKFRKSTFMLAGDPHVQYYNRHFGYVLRQARLAAPHEPYAPGLHHFCLRVESIADVHAVVRELRSAGIEASEAKVHAEYAPDYTATYFNDPDGIRLEVTNYRHERRERHNHWDRQP